MFCVLSLSLFLSFCLSQLKTALKLETAPLFLFLSFGRRVFAASLCLSAHLRPPRRRKGEQERREKESGGLTQKPALPLVSLLKKVTVLWPLGGREWLPCRYSYSREWSVSLYIMASLFLRFASLHGVGEKRERWRAKREAAAQKAALWGGVAHIGRHPLSFSDSLSLLHLPWAHAKHTFDTTTAAVVAVSILHNLRMSKTTSTTMDGHVSSRSSAALTATVAAAEAAVLAKNMARRKVVWLNGARLPSGEKRSREKREKERWGRE